MKSQWDLGNRGQGIWAIYIFSAIWVLDVGLPLYVVGGDILYHGQILSRIAAVGPQKVQYEIISYLSVVRIELAEYRLYLLDANECFVFAVHITYPMCRWVAQSLIKSLHLSAV